MRDGSPVAVVTGAGSGLGLECALHLASSGWNVFGAVLTAQEEENLREHCRARNLQVRSFPMDVTDETQVQSGLASVIAAAGRIDALVQFAGLGLRGFFEDLDDDEIRRVFDVNVFGVMAVARAVLPYMRQARGGRIVITSSVAGRMASMSIGGYASSKFAVEGFAECLRQEVYPFGIRVSLLEPGLIATPHFTVNRNRGRRAVDPASPYYSWFCQHENLVDRILVRRSFTAADVARQVERIVCARKPKLRYVVGWKARLVFSLRRHIPGEWFQDLYWSFVRRIVTRPKAPVSTLSGAESNEFSRSSRAHAGRQ